MLNRSMLEMDSAEILDKQFSLAKGMEKADSNHYYELKRA